MIGKTPYDKLMLSKGVFNMQRKRITELFPFLLPLRRRERIFFFYQAMKRDGRRYAEHLSRKKLPVLLFESKCPMYNRNTGFPMLYQENKVHNLKLAASALDGLVVRPGESFSFWNRVRNADRAVPYKEALSDLNGRLMTEYGGGLCMMSNLLCWLFLNTPMTFVERHGHSRKDFPEPESDALNGTDATVAEGWKDLKICNGTDNSYQICVGFDEENIIGSIRTDKVSDCRIYVENRNLRYVSESGSIFEESELVRKYLFPDRNMDRIELVYTNNTRIDYMLPEDTVVERR